MADLASWPVRCVLLAAAIITYALFGSPTPDDPGWPEIAVALLLLGAGAASVPAAFSPRGAQSPLKLLMLYGLSMPLIIGAMKGHDALALLRDVVPFLFLCLPLFLAPVAGRDARSFRMVAGALYCLGVIFALRALGPAYGWLPPSGELYYLSNAPTVLFTAIMMAGVMMDRLAPPFSPRRLGQGIVALAAIMIILWAMLLDTQRATIVAIVFSLLCFFLLSLRRGVGRVIVPAMIASLLIAVFVAVFQDAAHAMAQKTAKVGLNMRLEELKAVIDAIGGSLSTAMFGLGWGAKLASPAVADIEVAFTHSLLSYLLLKTGLCGLLIALIWLTQVGLGVLARLRVDPVSGLALFWSLLIPVFFYASHKSLDFGLILVMATVLADGRHGYVASAKPGV